MSFVEIAQTDQIPIETMKSFSINGKSVLVANIEESFTLLVARAPVPVEIFQKENSKEKS
jgi:hypothetical protein